MRNNSISNLYLDELSDVEKQLVKDVIVRIAQIPYTEPKYRYDLDDSISHLDIPDEEIFAKGFNSQDI